MVITKLLTDLNNRYENEIIDLLVCEDNRLFLIAIATIFARMTSGAEKNIFLIKYIS